MDKIRTFDMEAEHAPGWSNYVMLKKAERRVALMAIHSMLGIQETWKMEHLISVIFLFKNKASSLILGLDWIRMNHKLLGWLPLGLNNLQQVHIGWLSASASEERKSLSAKERIARATWQVTEDPSSGGCMCAVHLHIYTFTHSLSNFPQISIRHDSTK